MPAENETSPSLAAPRTLGQPRRVPPGEPIESQRRKKKNVLAGARYWRGSPCSIGIPGSAAAGSQRPAPLRLESAGTDDPEIVGIAPFPSVFFPRDVSSLPSNQIRRNASFFRQNGRSTDGQCTTLELKRAAPESKQFRVVSIPARNYERKKSERALLCGLQRARSFGCAALASRRSARREGRTKAEFFPIQSDKTLL